MPAHEPLTTAQIASALDAIISVSKSKDEDATATAGEYRARIWLDAEMWRGEVFDRLGRVIAHTTNSQRFRVPCGLAFHLGEQHGRFSAAPTAKVNPFRNTRNNH